MRLNVGSYVHLTLSACAKLSAKSLVTSKCTWLNTAQNNEPYLIDYRFSDQAQLSQKKANSLFCSSQFRGRDS